jgi:hypothetical protein
MFANGNRLNDIGRQDEGDCNAKYTESTVLHAVNLATLDAFYDGGNGTLSGHGLFNTSLDEFLGPVFVPMFGDMTKFTGGRQYGQLVTKKTCG